MRLQWMGKRGFLVWQSGIFDRHDALVLGQGDLEGAGPFEFFGRIWGKVGVYVNCGAIGHRWMHLRNSLELLNLP